MIAEYHVAPSVARARPGHRKCHRVGVVDLTHRQHEVLALICQGCAAREIAARIGVAKRTIDFHTLRLHRLFGVRSNIALAFRVAELSGQMRLPLPPLGIT